MPSAKRLFDQVLEAQKKLGAGEPEEALKDVTPLREQAIEMLDRSATMTSFQRSYALAAYAYSTVTLVLGLAEARLPAEFVPRARELAKEALGRNRQGSDVYKVIAAAAEVLARAGDSQGAVWAIKKARALSPDNDELAKIQGGISSMYPQVFKEMEGELPDEPPETPAPKR